MENYLTEPGKATSYTSRSTTAFLEKVKINTSIECMPFQLKPEKALDELLDLWTFVPLVH